MTTTLTITARLAADFAFAQQGDEFRATAPLLRYVASLNQGASKTEFIDAAVAAGFPRHAAMARFGESRRFDIAEHGEQYDNEGRNVRP